MFTRFTPNDQLERTGRGRWRATGPDPQFLLSPHPRGARYAVVEIACLAQPLDAAVYLRTAGVFSEAERLDFPEARHLLLVIDLRAGPGRAGLRIDPAEETGARFSCRIWTRRSRNGLMRLVRRRLAGSPGLTVDLIGPDPGLSRQVQRLRLPVPGRPGLAQQLARIWELAACEAALDPLPPAMAVEISFLVPVHNAEPAWLDALLASFHGQERGAELILSDDGSTRPDTAFWLASHDREPGVRILRAPSNGGIAAATNRALVAARGTWIGLVDHDDALAPHAVGRIRRALRDAPQAEFLYTDEVIADEAMTPVSVFLKPGFDPVLLSGVNYVNHLSLYRRERLAALGGLREGYQGSQDYELVLRYCRGLPAARILHLPYPAYVWRQRAGSLSHAGQDGAVRAARRALAEHFGGPRGHAPVVPALLPDLHRVRLAGPRPAISIVIPNRDSAALITRLLADLYTRTEYGDFEVIVVDNGSTDPAVLGLYQSYADRGNFRAEVRPEPFNFAAMVNRGAALARGDAILLLNNDISVIEPGWLAEMAECLAYPGTGIVGARLLFPDRTLQHGGVVLGLGGYAGHWYYRAAEDDWGPMGRLAVRNAMSVVTGACMLVTRPCWEALGGMDAERFAVAYNDVDFCARARARDFGVVWTPFATLFHHESASRGSDMIGEKARRFAREKAALAARHGTATVLDPCLSPWYSRYQSRPRLIVGDRLPAPRGFHGFSGWPVPVSLAGPSGDPVPMPRSARG